MYELTKKIYFGNCTNILDIEHKYKVSTSASLANFKKVLMGYPFLDHLYRLIWIDGQYCAIRLNEHLTIEVLLIFATSIH